MRQGRIMLLFIHTLLLLLLASHASAFDDITLDNQNAKIISTITGREFDAMPYYYDTGVTELHSMGYNGSGIVVGVIGEGLNIQHEAFRQAFKRKEVIGYDFVNDQRYTGAATVYPFREIQYGRGSITTGIVASNAKAFHGVAPDVAFGIYRVIDRDNTTSTSVVLKALDMAMGNRAKIVILPEIRYKDKPSYQLRNMIAKAAKEKKMIMVVAATRNNFANPAYFSYDGLPVLRVGGANLPYLMSHWFTDTNTNEQIKFSAICKKTKYDIGTAKIIIYDSWEHALRPLNKQYITGNVLMVKRPYQHTSMLLKKLEAVGAIGVVTTYAPPKRIPQCTVPFFKITQDGYEYIVRNYRHTYNFNVEQGSTLLGTHANVEPILSPDGKREWPVRPDIIAPSTNMKSPRPRNHEQYMVSSNITNAVAYVAGAVALLVQSYLPHRMDYHEVRDHLRRGALPLHESKSPLLAPVERQGAGLINVANAARPIIYTIPAYIEFTQENTRRHIKELSIGAHASAAYLVLSWRRTASLPVCASNAPEGSYNQACISPVFPKVIMPSSLAMTPVSVDIEIKGPIPPGSKLAYSGYIAIKAYASRDATSPIHTIHVPCHGIVAGNPS
ncbi:peptidase S8/S53 domain-containing protein [Syncephalis pseudoplumigaleata]|uniref:Peptidase S8/S53 domain-containing protein n=1 Tax=Syncephalis pseudoplumigaleata TaxID=1712513 RepID=A0A4P9Z5S4_9FUNG|nr:peptidase S8/S53 domain-containing protein [Syncephalis pseudoplumigaleata]|eukprot:RKP27936.1 peptidase S8/S53 domain-containing protein [Syncephalis pseudoplumigaleata]